MGIIKNSPPFTKAYFAARIDNFLVYLQKNRGRGALTIKVYRQALQEAFALAIFDDRLKTIDFMPYREAIAAQAPKTIAKKLSAIRSYLDYMEIFGSRFHAYALESAKVPKCLPKPATHKQILQTVRASGGGAALLIEFIYALGLRIGEAANIKIDDIESNWLRISGKGGKTRQVPILNELKIRIDRYIRERNPKRFLFEKNGEPLRENQLRYKIARSFKGVGLKITPHQLRHAFATEMLNGGARIADVSEILGHSQMATTEIYTKLSSSLKLKNYLRAHPLCKGGER
ncbi:MAG: tyrosine-type recombinase/integrase [Helicobacteraceae bacterium]|jgi:integrase/recombinase XerC|nr:tyrosine-type recombinase/integrase [Helicobacteraceae bacterium]